MDEKRWPEFEQRKAEQQNHDMLIHYGADIEHMKETLTELKGSVDGMVKTLIQDRKECWETCNKQLRAIEATATIAKTSIDEAKASIRTVKAIGATIAFIFTVIAGWVKLTGGTR